MGNPLESLTVDVKDNVARVTLIGPGKGNAMGPAFWAEMPVVFAELDDDPEVRAIVLTGSGANFTYGLDLLAMGNTLSDTMSSSRSGEVSARPRTEFHATVKRMQQSITAVADCRTPTIAAIHGWCIGGGVDLISAVDIRYASADVGDDR
ncbi:MAG: enoyl-CoA hydratase, partial [Mycobacteriaceae bacterium]|nr:enoyl-CoA hydratase [Mycobacteriaceae bacterium]